jgi:hypothetical protein
MQDFETLEHKIVGEFDNKGWFKGNVIAFGQDKGEISIPPNIDINSRTGVGSFKLQMGSFYIHNYLLLILTKLMSSIQKHESTLDY